MATLAPERIGALLRPFVAGFSDNGAETTGESLLPAALLEQLSVYLDLLVRWNSRVSLTAVQTPEEMVRRHFGESLFTGLHLALLLEGETEVLDYGSGAGFPGLPIQLLLPKMKVTLAESQARKAAFLREVVRNLSVDAEVWPRRVEEMPEDRRFDAVTLRAVDRMQGAIVQAERRLKPGGWMVMLAGKQENLAAGVRQIPMPESQQRHLLLWNTGDVPRGTSL